MNEVIVSEYVELSAQIAAEALFAEEVEQRRYDRLDQLWYVEMTEVDRAETERRIAAQACVWHEDRCTSSPFDTP